MYLPPLKSAALLPLVQLSSLLRNSNTPALPSAVEGAAPGYSLGNLSPYHDAPPVLGVSVGLPDDCTVTQVILLHRHGSRGPRSDQDYIDSLEAALLENDDAIKRADLPHELDFLKGGYTFEGPESRGALTLIGRKELLDHGVEFALRYPGFFTDEIVTTESQRVIQSAYFFCQGFFGSIEGTRLLGPRDFADSVFWLNPWLKCPRLDPKKYTGPTQVADQWARKYIPPIVERLNGLVPGIAFSPEDIRGALYACAYDLAIHNRSPWCNVFTAEELQGLEYELDLHQDHRSGHKNRNDPGPLVGALYVKKLIERLTNSDGAARPLHLEFAHQSTILFALSAMGLNKDGQPLNPEVNRPPSNRRFRTSNQVPFAAEMIWEKFVCHTSFGGPQYPQVRLVLNGATFPLTTCEDTEEDEKYGTCSLASFVRANRRSMNVRYHDARWNNTCGVDD